MKTEWIDNNQQCTMNNVQWKKVKLGDCLTIGNGQDYKHLQSGDIPVFGTGGVMTFVDTFLYDGETVCIGRKGTINKPMYYNGKIWTVDTLFYTHSFLNVLPKFIYYVFCNIDWNKYNEATGVPSLSKETIYKIEISIPYLPVQRRIAAILSSADKVIASTQKVIDKLKQIKQGMMDDLLKPKDGWRMVKLGEVYNFQYGDGNKNPNNNGDYPIYGANGIIGGYTKFNAVDSVVIGHMGEYAGSVIWANGKHFVTYNGTITIVKDNNSLYDRFGYFVLLNLDIKKICAGSGQPFLSYDTLNKIEISIPDLAEQSRIASILSGIDSKIAAEEKVLEKYKAVKKGLMEKLLNGK